MLRCTAGGKGRFEPVHHSSAGKSAHPCRGGRGVHDGGGSGIEERRKAATRYSPSCWGFSSNAQRRSAVFVACSTFASVYSRPMHWWSSFCNRGAKAKIIRDVILMGDRLLCQGPRARNLAPERSVSPEKNCITHDLRLSPPCYRR